jgi:hypothetical protein
MSCLKTTGYLRKLRVGSRGSAPQRLEPPSRAQIAETEISIIDTVRPRIAEQEDVLARPKRSGALVPVVNNG